MVRAGQWSFGMNCKEIIIFRALPYQPKKEERYIGIWGRRYLQYIREHKKVLYTNLLTSGKLQSHLADVEEQAVL